MKNSDLARFFAVNKPKNDGYDFVRKDGEGDIPDTMNNPMTAQGDLIVGGANGSPTRLGKGQNGYALFSNGTGLEWRKITDEKGMDNPMTAQGDIIIGGLDGDPDRLPLGTDGQILKSNGTTLEWGNPAAPGMANPMTTEGDLIIADSNGSPDRLPVGTAGQVLISNGTTVGWSNIPTPSGINYLTTEPSSANVDGDLKIVILDAEPTTYYDGYYYIITETAVI